MRVQLQAAFILHRRPYRNTSLLLEALVQEHGRLGLVARGAATDLAGFYRWCETRDKPIFREFIQSLREAYGGTPDEQPETYHRHSALANYRRLTMPHFLSHGAADELEENIVWRIAELLGVSTRDRMELKRKSQAAGAEGLPENPWDDAGGGI